MKIYPLIRPLLFRLEPERAHRATLKALEIGHRLRLNGLLAPPSAPPCEIMGLRFSNRVGLAAGLDKNGDHIDALAALGFGFIEIGTTTPRPQPGNPPPRLFRLPQAEALINRMGFNNKGVDYLVSRVKEARTSAVIGINIGKNFDTPMEKALDDYRLCMRKVYPCAGYITINISSPNTPGLRELQHRVQLVSLIEPLKEQQQKLAAEHGRYVPFTVKIAPDLEREDLFMLAEILKEHEVDGVIATNTTLDHGQVKHLPHGGEAGGLSGAPLRQRSTRVVRQLAEALQGALPIIGTGGIMSGADAREKMAAGARLVQIYTGLVYRGPALIREVVASLQNNELR